MRKSALKLLLLIVLVSPDAPAQSLISTYTYSPPAQDSEARKRLNLLLSSTFLVVAKEGQADYDSCLFVASRSLGISRFPVMAEGFSDDELLSQSGWIDSRKPAIGLQQLAKATGRKRLQRLLLLGAYYVFEANGYPLYKDSVDHFLQQAVRESKALGYENWGRIALCLQARFYAQANDPKGDTLFRFLLQECRTANDKENEARAAGCRGIYTAPTQTSLPQKVADLQLAATLYRSLGHHEKEIHVSQALGYLIVLTGDLPQAGRVFSRALELSEADRFPYTHYLFDALALVTLLQGKFGEPLRFARMAIKTAEMTRDSIGWGYFYSRLSEMYGIEDREDESVAMARKAIRRFVADNNHSVYNVLNTLVDYLCRQGKPDEALTQIGAITGKLGLPNNFSDQSSYHYALAGCYLKQNKLDEALLHTRLMDTAETKAEMIRGPFRRSLVTGMYGYIFFKQGHYQQARSFFQKHFTDSSYGQHSLANDLLTYRWLLETDSAMNDPQSALAHYKKYTALLDSNFKVTKIRQAEELAVLYETQEKENQIALLNRQAGLEKANLAQATLVKNLVLAGIAAALVIAALLYRQNRLKQRTNRVIIVKNEQLQQLLTDKEWLLKEIHHRVKNNLQIVMSLLNSQAMYIDNDVALAAIDDSKRRVHAMALIHQKLYQSDTLANIAMREYIGELVSHLKDGFDTGHRIVFEESIEAIDLDIAQAIPLGLIINESLVNAVKYAFPGGRKGTVKIRLHRVSERMLQLEISDDGVGLPAKDGSNEQPSLGLELIHGLANQLKGSLQMVNNNGLHLTFRFSVFDALPANDGNLSSQLNPNA